MDFRLGLGNFYAGIYEFDKAEENYLKVLEVEPSNFTAALTLVSLYVAESPDRNKAKKIVKYWEENFPDNYDTKILVAQYYQGVGRHAKAKDILNEAIKMDPQRFQAYYDLAEVNFHSGDTEKTLPVLKKAIDRLDDNFSGEERESLREDCYFLLAKFYNASGKYQKAEEVLSKIKTAEPNSSGFYFILGEARLGQGKISKAIKCFIAAKRLNPYKSDYYLALRKCYDIQGKGKSLRSLGNNLAFNYREIVKIILKNNIGIVCVHYPMCNLESLKEILSDIEGIVFVDNEEVFKEATDGAAYEDYFLDRCGGIFGHATQKGNRLLAENIAETVLKEVEKLKK